MRLTFFRPIIELLAQSLHLVVAERGRCVGTAEDDLQKVMNQLCGSHAIDHDGDTTAALGNERQGLRDQFHRQFDPEGTSTGSLGDNKTSRLGAAKPTLENWMFPVGSLEAVDIPDCGGGRG
jgi:hypothetical protein